MADSSLSRLPGVVKAGIGLGLLALVAVAYFVVFYGDVASRINSARTQAEALRQQLDEARRNELSYQKDLAELAEREQKQRELNKVLPTSSEYPAFLSSIQSVANVSGVNLSGWNPQEEVVEAYYARVPMKLSFSGKFHQVAKFFFGVSQLDRIINMENITIKEAIQSGEEVVIKVEALATAFRGLPDAGVDRRAAGQEKAP